MSKKTNEDEIEDQNLNDESPIENIDDDTSEFEIVENPVDDDNIEIVIEIDDDIEIKFIEEETTTDEEVFEDDIVLSKHKLEGKHSLKYDSIFKGKKDDSEEEDPNNHFFNEKFELDKSSSNYSESYDNEQYIRSKLVKEKVYQVLKNKTNISFLNNRRKPSRVDFNSYYILLRNELVNERFTNVEIFNELSVYFSDNLFNMFKLLDNKWRNIIISELQDHIGKNNNSKEISNRNIYEGTELEFQHTDVVGEVKYYTGVVTSTNYQESIFKIDSYESIYEVHISSITKILNNTKFKHNLNKLNNIDFL